MKIKKFNAPSMPKVMKKVRHELGKDAVILNTKEVASGGFLGFFAKKQLEVVAAIDPDPIEQEQSYPPQKKAGDTRDHKNDHAAKQLGLLQKEIEGMRKYPGSLADINDFLSRQEVTLEFRTKLMNQLVRMWYASGESMSQTDLYTALAERIEDMVATSFPAEHQDCFKKYLLLVGPTGVGKTTTLAKIAGKAMLEEQKTIAFITTDTYRIAAIEQLKTYANILDVPVEVVYSHQEFQEAKQKFSGFDLVLIDSAGRNFRQQLFVNELKQTFPSDEAVETHLVFSLTSKYEDMKTIYKQFAGFDINHVIFTKMDETSTFGAMFNFIKSEKVQPSYVTSGQNVPDDLVAFSPSLMANVMMGAERDA